MKVQKKILVLGGKPIGSIELVNRLHEMGHYVIVTDYLTTEESPAKQFADEAWDISTGDINVLYHKIIENEINAIMTGVHEFNINKMLELCELTGLPCYCNKNTWKYCDNKGEFKSLCIKNNIPIAQTYSLTQIKTDKEIKFPLIVKPIDGSGSRGFHICTDIYELEFFYNKAKKFSPSGQILIEQFIPHDTVIIHYTMLSGKCIFSGISDKKSVKFKSTGASVMGIQTFPSKGEYQFLEGLNEQVIKMFENTGFKDGPIWIEAFYDGDKTFIFNEMGYRFGGSLSFYPVKYFTGIDQLDLMIYNALGEKNPIDQLQERKNLSNYCILPIHLKSGQIKSISISEQIIKSTNYHTLVPVHHKGDIIQEWGSAQQVFAYAHILYSTIDDLIIKINELLEGVKVTDENGNNQIHTLFDINSLKK